MSNNNSEVVFMASTDSGGGTIGQQVEGEYYEKIIYIAKFKLY